MIEIKEEFAHRIGTSEITIAFERMGNPENPPTILIMGAGAQMISWHNDFCKCLVDRGLFLVRFDSRDSGNSTHFTNAPAPDFSAVMKGDFDTVSYTLSDMAADTIGLLDFLGLEKVHLVGASMGGMIAQKIAIEHPGRVKSLTSIMSTTGNSSVGQADFSILSKQGMPPFHDREEYIKWRVKSMNALSSPNYLFDEEWVRESAALSWDRDHDPLGMTRQAVAVLKSGDRTKELMELKTPTLVIHGDSDKMCDVSGGIATANAVPRSKLHILKGMGHNLPKQLWNEIADLIAEHIHTFDKDN